MKQPDLAEKLNCTAMTISRYERGEADPDVATILRLCEIFDCTADYLLGRSAVPSAELSPEEEDLLKSDAGFRVIPIPPQLVEYLRNLRAARIAALPKRSKKDEAAAPAQRILAHYVYCMADGSPVTMTAFRRRWETIRSRSTASGRPLGEKVRNRPYSITLDVYPTPHELRHTYITRLILGGVDLKRVQYLAGHADPKVTLQIYTDLMGHAPEDLIGDVERIFATKP